MFQKDFIGNHKIFETFLKHFAPVGNIEYFDDNIERSQFVLAFKNSFKNSFDPINCVKIKIATSDRSSGFFECANKTYRNILCHTYIFNFPSFSKFPTSLPQPKKWGQIFSRFHHWFWEKWPHAVMSQFYVLKWQQIYLWFLMHEFITSTMSCVYLYCEICTNNKKFLILQNHLIYAEQNLFWGPINILFVRRGRSIRKNIS